MICTIASGGSRGVDGAQGESKYFIDPAINPVLLTTCSTLSGLLHTENFFQCYIFWGKIQPAYYGTLPLRYGFMQ